MGLCGVVPSNTIPIVAHMLGQKRKLYMLSLYSMDSNTNKNLFDNNCQCMPIFIIIVDQMLGQNINTDALFY